MSDLVERIRTVQANLRRAAERAGRAAEEVTLVAVTKLAAAEQVRAAYAAGLRVFGENRVQDARRKMEALADLPDIQWHMIGHLQTNKVKPVLGHFQMIHAVDSWHLAEALHQEAEKQQLQVPVLLEVNLAGEESKYGFALEVLEQEWPNAAKYNRLTFSGLMTMAPWVDDPEAARPVFRALRELRGRLSAQPLPNADLRRLSMGMTNDYEVAVEEGATLVRVGTAIFGG